ncbi:uncharacterized protein EI97DRAFT_471202 [Westerdykella ornata]|uniref:Uncharacterized protein n=1 Tax=Westerdykella ornata TaxID=318751 RepID=A0A6A6J5D0_WESOR|nr:uncharacterized protein EI97DRAFT_471202 [Westerdykella ornata]KAF2271424.1 hypothetical protein EI97DRAFT_471202 [Westerdykella ornata]
MNFSALIVLISASLALASPAAVSLNRSTKEMRDAKGNMFPGPCVECPCEEWAGCRCVPNGCCCT